MFQNRYVLVCFLALGAFVNCVPLNDNELQEVEPDSKYSYEDLFKQSISGSVSRFSINLLQKLSEETNTESNIFTSPVSAYAALYLLHLGAGDQTRNKLNDVLKLRESNVDVSKMHETFSELYKKLEHRSSNPDVAGTETTFANGFFLQKDYPIRDSFIQSMREYYKANVTSLDFVAHAEEATNMINSFIAEGTRNRIKDFYKTPLPSNTVGVLANALYFKGRWEHAFDEEQTKPEKFNTGTTEIEVPMMHGKSRVRYSYSNALQLETLELKYKGGEYSMIFCLPRPGQTVKNMTKHFHDTDVEELNRNSKMVGVDYKIPKMIFSWEGSLIQPLHLVDVFRNADLSRMTTATQGVTVSEMKQVTEMEVDEHGTIATAATTISASRKFLQQPLDGEFVKFYVDRPFSVNIIHTPTNMIVFNGMIYNPAQK